MSSKDLTACEEFHGLQSRPFSLTPDLRFTYHSRSHTQALEQISQALKRREGLIVVTGEVGTGKTMLCRALLDTFEARTFLSVILDPLLTVDDLLYQVLTDFGVVSATDRPGPRASTSDVRRHDMVTTLHKFLASLVPIDAHAVIMIDEAQHLTGPVLEQVRLLSNFETDAAKLLQIVLVGQPNLDILLRRPDMHQLNQRVARRCELGTLSIAEVSDYVERRLLVASEGAPPAAGGSDASLDPHSEAPTTVQFTATALGLVAAVSRGTPRLVNTLCDRALEASFERREHIVDRGAVQIAAERLRLPIPLGQTVSWSVRLAAGAALVVVVALGAWWWTERSATTAAASSTQSSAPGGAPTQTPPASAPTPALEPTPSAAPPVGNTPEPPTAVPPLVTTQVPPSQAASARIDGPPQTGYEITAASFKTQERASAVVETLVAAGLRVSSRVDSTGVWHLVVVGPFVSSEDAKAAQDILARQGFTDTRISVR